MTFEFETLLVAGAWAFYLYDASILLFVDELMLEMSGRRCHVRSGATSLFAGKRPFIPNPLTPHRPLMRASIEDLLGLGNTRKADDMAHYMNALVPFKVLSLILLLLFGMALPLVLYWFGTGAELLCWLALVYLFVGCIVYHAYRRRLVLGLSPRALAMLAFECSACAPFAINVVRKLTLRRDVTGLGRFRAICGEDEFRSLQGAVGAHINRTLSQFDLGDAEALKLSEYQQKLAAGCTQ